MLRYAGGTILIDCGDGTAEQLAKVGVRLGMVKAIFISHLHFDHTGGLAAILGLRFQTNAPGKLAIYGPPGTKALVAGLIASMAPAAEAGYGLPDSPSVSPADMVSVTEISGGSVVDLGSLKITAAQNTHYSFAPGSAADRKFKSLAFRFDLPDRSIVYTGDTGPSPAVENLARNADLLVSEMIDVDATVAAAKRNNPNIDGKMLAGLVEHLTHHHLTPTQVGELARRAGVKAVVITHFVAPGATPAMMQNYIETIRKNFAGTATIAADLQSF
jgi:ribonuclease BN (tRNA processing enzyme)